MRFATKVLIGFIFATVLAWSSAVVAQVYPTHPVTMIVPFPAGGPADTVGRIMAQGMRVSLGQPVIVENIGGANGTVGLGRLTREAPDGYTVGIGHWSTNVVNGAVYDLPYDLVKDFSPVARLVSGPQFLVANKKVPADNLKEFIAWLKANPGKALAGTAGAGSQQHVSGVYFQTETKTDFHFVPYHGAAPAMQDLIGEHIDFMFDLTSNSLPQIRAGTIKAYGVTEKERLVSAPDIPTISEAGLPDFYVSVWFALWAPAGTPSAIIDKLNAAAVDAMADPKVQARFHDLGQDVPPRNEQSPQALAAFQKAEIEKWWPLIKAAKIKAE
jgi:tripartite-type tricarboxylate transporter receptor subunit TctC